MSEDAFTGDVQKDSPALYGKLKRGFDSACSARLMEAFRLSVLHSGASEWPVFRAKDTSFNPKPARIFEILTRECGDARPEILITGILAPSSLSCTDQAPTPSFDAELALAGQAQKFLERGDQVSEDAERIALALLLDELRHMHMSCLDLVNRARRLREVQGIISKVTHPEFNARLVVLLNTCCERLKSILGLPGTALERYGQ